MIRDPSDGTVREKSAIGIPITESKQPLIAAGTSGLATDRLKADELARLEKSREWLKNRIQSTTERSEISPRSPEQGEG